MTVFRSFMGHEWFICSHKRGGLRRGPCEARPLGAAWPLINPGTRRQVLSAGIYQRLSESIAPKMGLSCKYALAAGAPPMQRMITGLVCGPHL